jgi:hypothetical protein
MMREFQLLFGDKKWAMNKHASPSDYDNNLAIVMNIPLLCIWG